MVVHVFPAAKLGALLIKQISKPIANAVKNKAKSSPVFRKYVCLPPAQFYNWVEGNVKMWLLNLGQPVNITILNEAASIELGANLVGEGVIFLIAAGLLVSEYNRSSRKEAAKEAARLAELQSLQDSLRDLFIQTEEQGAYIREMRRTIVELAPHKPSENKPPIESPSPPSSPPSPPSSPTTSKPNVNNGSTIPGNKEELTNKTMAIQQNHQDKSGLLFKAINQLERDLFLTEPKNREPDIISTALSLFFKDVYKKNINF